MFLFSPVYLLFLSDARSFQLSELSSYPVITTWSDISTHAINTVCDSTSFEMRQTSIGMQINNWTIINILSWLIWKDPDAGKDWWQKEKGATEDEMVGWHHWLNGHGFGWTLGVGDGQGSLVCCGSWGYKELDMAEQLNWTELSPYAVL